MERISRLYIYIVYTTLKVEMGNISREQACIQGYQISQKEAKTMDLHLHK